MTQRAFLLLWAEAATAPELARICADQVAVAVVGQLRGIGLQRLVDPAADTERLRRAVTGQWRRALAPLPG